MLEGVRLLRGERLPAGFQLVPLRDVVGDHGAVQTMLTCADPHFLGFGEIYFSTIYKGAIKGWHCHREMTLNYACVVGQIKLVVFDDRAASATRGSLCEVYLGTGNHSLAVIPPELWNGFEGLTAPFAMVANCCTHAHDRSRSTRLDPFDPRVPYRWGRRDAAGGTG